MSMLTWLRGITGATEAKSLSGPDRTTSAPLSPRLLQEQRIWQKAAVYRQQRAARLTAKAEADAKEEQERIRRAQDEYEERMARALALGPSAFPGDEDDDVRAPRIVAIPVPQLWLDQQADMSDWTRRDRG